MSDFSKVVKAAQAAPPEAANGPFDPFATPTPVDELARPAEGPQAIPGMPEYALEFHSKRFYMGRELTEIDATGAKVFGDRDESADYITVMRMVMSGQALVINRHETIIGDGSVVIWLEWGVKKRLKPKKKKYLTVDELRSTTPTDAPTKDMPGGAVEEAVTDPSDEPDW